MYITTWEQSSDTEIIRDIKFYIIITKRVSAQSEILKNINEIQNTVV
jgi:hypothetical protein